MPDLEGTKLVKNTFALPEEYWRDLRLVAALTNSRPAPVLRRALDEFFARELSPEKMQRATDRKRAG